MKKIWVLIAVVVIVLGLGTWYFVHGQSDGVLPNQSSATTATNATTTPPLPTPTLATIAAVNSDGSITLTDQTGATATALVSPSTLIYQNGAPISSSALKVKEMVAVIYYPSSVGANNVAQSITVVSGQ